MIYAAAVLLIIMLLMFKLKYAFALSFFLQNTYFTINESVDIGSIALTVILVKLLYLGKINLLDISRRYKIVSLYLIFLVIMLIWSINFTGEALQMIITFIRCGIGLVVFIVIFEQYKEEKIFYNLFVATFLVVVFHNILMANGMHPFLEPSFEFGRLSAFGITGTQINSNTFAATIVILLTIILLIHRDKNDKRIVSKWLFLTLVIIALISIGYLGSRSAIITTLVLVPLLFIKKKIYVSIGLLVLIFIDIGSIEIPFIGDEANQRFQRASTEEIGSERQFSRENLFKAGVAIYKDHVLFGVGTGAEKKQMSLRQYLGEEKVIHNAFLSLLVQFGLMGIFLCFLFLRFGLQIFSKDSFVGIIFLSVFVINNLVHNYLFINITWIFLALMEIVSIPCKNHIPQNSSDSVRDIKPDGSKVSLSYF